MSISFFLFNVIALYVVDFLSTGSICYYVYSTLVIAYLLYCNFFLCSLINYIKKKKNKKKKINEYQQTVATI